MYINFAGPFEGRMFLVAVDAHSNWPDSEVKIMKSTTSQRTIEGLRELFVTYGLPDQVVSDNGSQFVSAEFQTFIRTMVSSTFDVLLTTHPQMGWKKAMLAGDREGG